MQTSQTRLTRRNRLNLAFAAMMALLMVVSGVSLHALSMLVRDSRGAIAAQRALWAIECVATNDGDAGRLPGVHAAAIAAARVDFRLDATTREALVALERSLDERGRARDARSTAAARLFASSDVNWQAALSHARSAAGACLARAESDAGASASHATLTIIFGSFCAICSGLLASVTRHAESSERRDTTIAADEQVAEKDRLLARFADQADAFRALLAGAPQAAVVVGAEHRAVAYNRAAAELFDLPAPDGQRTRGKLPPALPASFVARVANEAALSRVWRGERAGGALLRWRPPRQGAERFFAVYAEPIQRENGKPTGAVVLLDDCTERVSVAQREADLRQSVAAARRDFDLLIAAIAMPFAQPANDLAGSLERYARALARPQRVEPVDLDELAGDLLGQFESTIRETGAVVLATSLPTVAGDPDLLRLLLEVLLGRALDAAADWPAQVTLSASFDPQGECRTTVADARPVNLVASSFGSDMRDGDWRLLLCERIVEKHGGRLWVEAASDQGTFVHFTLPPASERQATEKSDAPAALGEPGRDRPFSPRDPNGGRRELAAPDRLPADEAMAASTISR